MEKNILALDLGKGSLGIAVSRSGMFVTPLKELRFKMMDFNSALADLKEMLLFEKVEVVAMGYPLFPSGDPCEMTPIVERFIPKVQAIWPNAKIVKVDERNSTVEAAAMLHANGEKAKKQRGHIDSAAAMVILERYLRSIGQAE